MVHAQEPRLPQLPLSAMLSAAGVIAIGACRFNINANGHVSCAVIRPYRQLITARLFEMKTTPTRKLEDGLGN